MDDYFDREIDPGIFELRCNGSEARDYALNLRDGVATLNISMPDNAKVDDRLTYSARLSDEFLSESIVKECANEFDILVTKADVSGSGSSGERKPPAGDDDGDREKPDDMAMPQVIEVFEAEWDKYKFSKDTALDVKGTGDNVYDFYINMDNLHLNWELKAWLAQNQEPKLLQSRFKYAMVLIGMAILKETTKEITEDADAPFDENGLDPAKYVAKFTSMVAPVVLPMIDTLGDLDIDSYDS